MSDETGIEQRIIAYEQGKEDRRPHMRNNTTLPEYRLLFGNEVKVNGGWMVTNSGIVCINPSPIQAFRDLATVLGYTYNA